MPSLALRRSAVTLLAALTVLVTLLVPLSRPAHADGPSLGQRAVAEAERHRGEPYSYGAAGPNRFDCSGFTMYVYGRLGKRLPHNAADQASVTTRIPNSAKQPGDLIFGYHGSAIGHVGIYAGGSKMWAAVQSGDTVRLQDFSSRAYSVGRVK